LIDEKVLELPPMATSNIGNTNNKSVRKNTITNKETVDTNNSNGVEYQPSPQRLKKKNSTFYLSSLKM